MKKLIFFIATMMSVLFLGSCNNYGGHAQGGQPAYEFYRLVDSDLIPKDSYGVRITPAGSDKDYYSLQFVDSSTANKTITFPTEYNGKPVKEIGVCTGLIGYNFSKVIIPDGIETILSGAFKYYPINEVELSNTVTTIGSLAFAYTKLEEVFIPDNVVSIKGDSFATETLKSIRVSESNLKYDSRDNCNAIIETNTNKLVEGIRTTIIPNTVTSIGASAFSNIKMSGITIPGNVKRIQKEAFLGSCMDWIELNEGLESIGESAFAYNAIKSVKIPSSVKEIGVESFHNSYVRELELNEGLEAIGQEAFSNNEIEEVVIPGSVQRIMEYAFYSNNITKLVLNEGLKKIASNAFSNNEIEELTIPSTVKSIDVNAFYGNELKKIEVSPLNPIYDSRDNCNCLIETETNYLIITSANSKIPDSVEKIYVNSYSVLNVIDDYTLSLSNLSYVFGPNISLYQIDKLCITSGFKYFEIIDRLSDYVTIYYEGSMEEFEKDLNGRYKITNRSKEALRVPTPSCNKNLVVCLDGYMIIDTY